MKKILSLLTAIALIFLSIVPVLAEDGAVILTKVSKTQLSAGEEFSYTVSLKGTFDGFGIAIDNSDLISITSVQAGNPIPTKGSPVSINVDAIGTGYQISVLGGLELSDCEETLIATVHAKVSSDAQPGTVTLKPKSVSVSNEYGDKAPLTEQYAEITVQPHVHTPSGTWADADDGLNHRSVCSVCGEEITEPHTGGTASCTNLAKCEICGAEYGEYAEHTETAVVTAPTCTEGGYTTYTCSVCGAVHTGGNTPALGHSYTDTVTAPTCTDKGYTTHICSVCGDEIVDTYVDALKHDYKAEVIAPACETQGYTLYTCTRCEDSYKDNYTNALDHTTETRYDETDHWTFCTRCESIIGEKSPHALEWTSDDTTHRQVCRECDYTAAQAAHSCTAWTKLDETSHTGACVCGKTLTEAHTGGTASCTEAAVCSVCGEAYGTPLGHKLTHYDRIEPSCTKEGRAEYWHCSVCGKNFLDEEGTTEAAEAEILPMTPHILDESKPLGHDAEKHWGTCAVCGTPISATEHTFSLVRADAQQHKEVCKTCGYEKTPVSHSFSAWTADADGHSRTCECGAEEKASHSGGTATCEKKAVCTACGAEYGEYAAHVYTETVTASTCTEKGYTTHTCSVCGDSYKDAETPAKGHSYTDTVTAPTCTEKGYTAHTCSVCGDSYKDAETPAKGHSYTETVTAPACTEKGYTTHTCSVCGDSYTDAYTDALGHDYRAVVTDPTCTEKGYTTYTCSVCGDSYTDAYTDALGHKWGKWSTVKEPTETEEGTAQRECLACHETETRSLKPVVVEVSSEATDAADVKVNVYTSEDPAAPVEIAVDESNLNTQIDTILEAHEEEENVSVITINTKPAETAVGSEITQVILPAASLEKIAEANGEDAAAGISVAVQLSNAEVELSPEVLQNVTDLVDSRSEDIRLVVEHQEDPAAVQSLLETAQIEKVMEELAGEEAADAGIIGVVEVSLINTVSGDELAVSGSVTVKIPFDADGLDVSKLGILYVSDDGSTAEAITELRYEDGCLIFTVPHLCTFVITGAEAEPEYVPESHGGNSIAESLRRAAYLRRLEELRREADAKAAQETAAAEAETAAAADEWINPFFDIFETDTYYDAIEFVYEHGLFKGVTDGLFAPHTTMTRAMFVTVLGRLAGVDEAAYSEVTFEDVVPGEWYAPYVAWAQENAIVKGYSSIKFGVNDEITVEQAAVILARYADFLGVFEEAEESLRGYADAADVSDWAYSAVNWAVANGILDAAVSVPAPREPAPRSLVAEMLFRFVTAAELSF